VLNSRLAMHTLTDEEFRRQPDQMLDDARRGKAVIVTVDGEAVMMTVPLGKGLASPVVRIELAARLFDSEQLSLGLAARIAGLSYSEMIDELGQRNIGVVRYGVDELKRELAYVATIAGY
jgi:predicted HTH domain antitoxin